MPPSSTAIPDSGYRLVSDGGSAGASPDWVKKASGKDVDGAMIPPRPGMSVRFGRKPAGVRAGRRLQQMIQSEQAPGCRWALVRYGAKAWPARPWVPLQSFRPRQRPQSFRQHRRPRQLPSKSHRQSRSRTQPPSWSARCTVTAAVVSRMAGTSSKSPSPVSSVLDRPR
jgi:hypothetical protein